MMKDFVRQQAYTYITYYRNLDRIKKLPIKDRRLAVYRSCLAVCEDAVWVAGNKAMRTKSAKIRKSLVETRDYWLSVTSYFSDNIQRIGERF